MVTIRELRQQLQAPRAAHDALYGRYVMRRFSVYLTVFFSRTPLGPSHVTALSLVAGLWGAWELGQGNWVVGVIGVNAWYLLDHVDGELSRLKSASSVTGLYFDTMVNAIVPPLALIGIGQGLHYYTGQTEMLLAGALGAYASLMLLLLPFAEAAVLLQWSRDSGRPLHVPEYHKTGPVSGPVLKRAFSALHFIVTFPVFLPLITLTVITLALASPGWLEPALWAELLFYASGGNLVWVTRLANTVLARKVDAHYESLKE